MDFIHTTSLLENQENVKRWQEYQNLIKEEITLNDISKLIINLSNQTSAFLFRIFKEKFY